MTTLDDLKQDKENLTISIRKLVDEFMYKYKGAEVSCVIETKTHSLMNVTTSKVYMTKEIGGITIDLKVTT